MSADKCLSIFSRQMEGIVYMFHYILLPSTAITGSSLVRVNNVLLQF